MGETYAGLKPEMSTQLAAALSRPQMPMYNDDWTKGTCVRILTLVRNNVIT